MRRLLRLVVFLGVTLAVLACAFVEAAPAASPVWPLEGAAETVLDYGATWSSDGAARTHRGVDLAADAGDPVLAPVDATVRFAGLVPGGEGRVGAVTLELESGRLLTLMPLASLRVETGERVSASSRVGELAEAGDASSGLPHLHVSLRAGETYLDPRVLLVPPAPEGDTEETTGDEAPAPASDVVPSAAAPIASPSDAAHQPSHAGSVRTPAAAKAPARAGAPVTISGEAGVPVTENGAAGAAAPSPGTALARGAGITLADGTAVSPAQAARASSAKSVRTAIADAAGPAPEAAARSAWSAASAIGRALSGAPAAIATGGRWIAYLVTALLAGIGCLWPLWRRDVSVLEPVRVTAGGDDIAAAVARW